MYVCINICMHYTCIYIYVYIYIHTCIHMYIYICICLLIWMSKSCLWNYVSIYLSICLSILPPFHRSKSIFLCIYTFNATATSQFQLCKWSLYGHGSQDKTNRATLQHMAAHENTRQRTATHYTTLQHTATHFNTFINLCICIYIHLDSAVVPQQTVADINCCNCRPQERLAVTEYRVSEPGEGLMFDWPFCSFCLLYY